MKSAVETIWLANAYSLPVPRADPPPFSVPSIGMRPFLIVGAPKSGTSTAVAVANAHPDAFCAYDVDFSKSMSAAGREAELCAYLPECAAAFERPAERLQESLAMVASALERRGFSYKALGVKVAALNPLIFTGHRIPTLFVVRDVRTWAAKTRTIQQYLRSPDDNAAALIASYVGAFVMSFACSHVQRCRLEDLYLDANSMPNAVAKVLALDAEPMRDWWTKTQWQTRPPKNYSSWFEGHASSFMPPVFSDTQTVLSDHPFWDTVLPIFDKYYMGFANDFPEAELVLDLRVLERAKAMEMTLNDAFVAFRSLKVRQLNLDADGKPLVHAWEGLEKRPGEQVTTLDVVQRKT
jgi:hypothetical protein